jgi:hydrogenase/urease accessory protein HupE
MSRSCICAGLIGLVLALLFLTSNVRAHESRPAYLEITETAPHQYAILWRTPLLSGSRLPVVLRFPPDVRNVTPPSERTFNDSIVNKYVIAVNGGLSGKRIEFTGLQATITDVLVRMQLLGGDYSTTLVHPSRPWIEIEPSHGALAVAMAYVAHGVEHILFGFDHLLFVLALILIVPGRRMLLWTVTAFTAAHSITLTLATLEVVHVPGPPVEASIALSIILLAWEIIRQQRGQQSLTTQWPWVVAFSFGLLHGFGFAGALTEIGLPRGDIPLALFSFNAGVEIGQLIFIAVVLSAIASMKCVGTPLLVERHARVAAAYTIGILAAFWLFERVSIFMV